VTASSPKRFSSFFYPIIDTDVCRGFGRDPLEVAVACLGGGARWLQLRSKHAGGAELLALADATVRAARGTGAIVIVNDRADIARMAGAGGVHVGQGDLPAADARAIVGPSAIVGLSTHDEPQVDAALQSSADYVAVGPVYATATKDTGYDPRGLALVRYAAGRGKPIVAIGGITLDRVEAVVAAGADGVAVISDVLREDPELRTRRFLEFLHV
jgi:thiamine-phosphate pyrophosphorylase